MASNAKPKNFCQLWAISISAILPVRLSFLTRDLYLLYSTREVHSNKAAATIRVIFNIYNDRSLNISAYTNAI